MCWTQFYTGAHLINRDYSNWENAFTRHVNRSLTYEICVFCILYVRFIAF